MHDLAPAIYRQRLVVEGIPSRPLTDTDISAYLSGLSEALDMLALIPPVTHRSPAFGWAGWIHWETSGAHMYAWDVPQLFFSVDIYTCKPFNVATAVEFTATVLDAQQVVHGRLPSEKLLPT
ncbi:S-adenosylmethionine decarboxylase [uncultured Jatrophihabitans sp.]|uniref:S-adenosylmethionine decarboxylase n=1 Tax=uncultured Jatrophihabitans sp. TaxID=1610747 RepID=UPI0035C96773